MKRVFPVVFFTSWYTACASAQMPPGEPDPCFPASGVVLEQDEPGCKVGFLLEVTEEKVERREDVGRECAEMHILIPQIPEPGERVILWTMLAKIEADSGYLCEGTIARAYGDAELLQDARDRRGASLFVQRAERVCQDTRGVRAVRFLQ